MTLPRLALRLSYEDKPKGASRVHSPLYITFNKKYSELFLLLGWVYLLFDNANEYIGDYRIELRAAAPLYFFHRIHLG